MSDAQYAALYGLSDTHWWCRGMDQIARALLESVDIDPASTRLLNVGCGVSAMVAWPRGYSQAVGLDLAMLALQMSHRHGAENLVAGSADWLPFAAQSFDLVAALDVLYHAGIEDNERTLANLWRVLRPGGWVLVRLPAYEWLRGPHDIVMGTRKRFTTRSARKLLGGAGFDIQRTTYANTWLFPLEAAWRITRRQFTSEKELSCAVSDLVETPGALNWLLATILGTERHLLRRLNLPFGLSVFCLARKPPVDD